jgi:hypothetical protein
VNVSEGWGGGAKSPEYNIEFASGTRLNAGLLAQRFVKYGTQVALRMTNAEVGGALHYDYSPIQPVPPTTNNSQAPQAPPVAQSATNGAYNTGSATDGPELKTAAAQFEALVLTQLIRAAKESGSGTWLNAEEGDGAAGPVMQMAEEYLSQALSSTGQLGLATLITNAIQKQQPMKLQEK